MSIELARLRGRWSRATPDKVARTPQAGTTSGWRESPFTPVPSGVNVAGKGLELAAQGT
jgi:hypothetical protein